MIENLEALAALAEEGTMGRAGLRLRVSQSAVSKRISTLEGWLKRPLLARVGRRVQLTPAAVRLLERVAPAIAELKAAVSEEVPARAGTVRVGVSESVLASWGAHLFAAARDASPGLTLELHAHRSPVVADRVSAGEYQLGLVAGAPPPGLRGVPVAAEDVVVIPAGGRRPARRPRGPLGVITIEAASASWAALAPGHDDSVVRVVARMESFFAVGQAARAGLGHGLVPAGVARALGVGPADWWRPGRRRWTRPVGFIGRPSALARPAVAAVVEAAVAAVAAGDLPLFHRG